MCCTTATIVIWCLGGVFIKRPDDDDDNKINERRPRLVREKAAEVSFDAARGLRPLHLHAPDVSPSQCFSIISTAVCVCAAVRLFGGGRSEQNRSDIKQRAAPSCTALEGSLDVLLNMKGADGGAARRQRRAPCQRKARHVRPHRHAFTPARMEIEKTHREKITQTRARQKV